MFTELSTETFEAMKVAAARLFPKRRLLFQMVTLKIGEDPVERPALIISGRKFRFGILTHEEEKSRTAEDMIEEMELRVRCGEYDGGTSKARAVN